MRSPAIFLIVFYQKVVSPWKQPTCRFYPSCSEYARISITKYGFMKGFFFAAARFCRCHPFNKGGFDPVR